MKWIKRISAATAAVRLTDESLYAQAFDELNQGIRRDGLWAKALANAEGNETKARGLYLQYRVQSYKDEAALLEQSTVPTPSSIAHPPSHSAAQQARVADDNKQRRAASVHGRQHYTQAPLSELPQMSASEKDAQQEGINGYDSSGYTPLMNAVKSYDLVRVRNLVNKGADTKLKDNNFGTSTASDMAHLALRRATDEGSRDILKRIIIALDGE